MSQAAKLRIDFYPDSEAQKLLESVPGHQLNEYINAAIKEYKPVANPAATGLSGTADVGLAGSPAAIMNAELRRIFDGPCGMQAADSPGTANVVSFNNSKTGETIRCETADVISMLKSLRPPITPGEVWEILEAFQAP